MRSLFTVALVLGVLGGEVGEVGQCRLIPANRFQINFAGVGTPPQVGEVLLDEVGVCESPSGTDPGPANCRHSLVDLPGPGQDREKISRDTFGQVFLLGGIPPVQKEVIGPPVDPHFLRGYDPNGEGSEAGPAVRGSVALYPTACRDQIRTGHPGRPSAAGAIVAPTYAGRRLRAGFVRVGRKVTLRRMARHDAHHAGTAPPLDRRATGTATVLLPD